MLSEKKFKSPRKAPAKKRPIIAPEAWHPCRKRMKAFMEERGLSDTELGRRMRPPETQSAVWNVFNYDTKLDIDLVARMAEAMGALPAALAYGTDLTVMDAGENVLINNWRKLTPSMRESLLNFIGSAIGVPAPKKTTAPPPESSNQYTPETAHERLIYLLGFLIATIPRESALSRALRPFATQLAALGAFDESVKIQPTTETHGKDEYIP